MKKILVALLFVFLISNNTYAGMISDMLETSSSSSSKSTSKNTSKKNTSRNTRRNRNSRTKQPVEKKVVVDEKYKSAIIEQEVLEDKIREQTSKTAKDDGEESVRDQLSKLFDDKENQDNKSTNSDSLPAEQIPALPEDVEKDNSDKNTEVLEIEKNLTNDFRNFLQTLYAEREASKKDSMAILRNMNEVLNNITDLTNNAKKEIRQMTYFESRNLIIASVFLWISITLFVVINLIFMNNLKKELYFLRNGLLRGEIKENMAALLEQLTELNNKLNNRS